MLIEIEIPENEVHYLAEITSAAEHAGMTVERYLFMSGIQAARRDHDALLEVNLRQISGNAGHPPGQN